MGEINYLRDSATGVNYDLMPKDGGITEAKLSDELQEKLQELELGIGSPLVASTAAEMTDTDKIYVYTGSETGYTSGNWYYYNGSAWTSGGVYNSMALETDKTLQVSGAAADAKVVGDEVTQLKEDLNAISESSKNLLPDGTKTTTLNNTNVVYSDGVLTISGTADSNGGRLVHLSDDFTLSAGTYTLSLSGQTPAIFIESGNTILAQASSPTFTLTGDTSCYVGVNLVNGTTYDHSINIQVEQGSTATAFLPPSYSTAIDVKTRENIETLVDTVSDIYDTEILYNDVNNLTWIVPDSSAFYWLGTAKKDGVITSFDGIGTSGAVPYIAVVRSGILVAKNPLTVNTGSHQTTDLNIIVKEGDDVFVGGAVGSIGLRTDTTYGITIKQFNDATVGSAVTVTEVTSTKFRYNCMVSIVYGQAAVNAADTRKEITVGTGKDFTSLSKALEYAYNRGNCDVVVFSGTYDIYTEMGGASYFDAWTYADTLTGGGLLVGNNCRYLFAPDAKVTFEYTGSNNAVKGDFSPINAGNGDFELIGLNLRAKNCRYAIHDEMGRAGIYVNRTPVRHRYKGINLYIDNTENTAISKRQCIGGGLGDATFIDIDGCKFESATPNIGNVYWHNYGSGGVSSIHVTGCDFKTGTFEAQYYGSQTDITECFVNNCKMALDPIVSAATSGSTVVNISINDWNNVIA